MRMFGSSMDGDDDDHDMDYMYQMGLAQEREDTRQVSASQKYPALWELFKTIPPKPGQAPGAKAAFEDLIKRYSEPHRAYHTVAHLEDLASQYEFYRPLLRDAQAKAVLCALFLHDVIYDCEPGKDESKSAAYADGFLNRLGVKERVIQHAVDIIKATAKHMAEEADFATRLFLDMDMSILAARPDIYAFYVSGVRAEFCAKLNLADEEFNEARARLFLRPTLAKGAPIFSTDQYKELEPLARANLRRELEGAYNVDFRGDFRNGPAPRSSVPVARTVAVSSP